MPDRLYLSLRLRGYNANNMLRHYERMLKSFPFSRLSKSRSVLRINAVSESEPPVHEQSLKIRRTPIRLSRQRASSRTTDCVVQLETHWDLWQFDKDWQLAPANVTLACVGPEFETDEHEDLRIDFGIDTHFLPQRDLPNHLFMARSNIRSLLHLVADWIGADSRTQTAMVGIRREFCGEAAGGASKRSRLLFLFHRAFSTVLASMFGRNGLSRAAKRSRRLSGNAH